MTALEWGTVGDRRFETGVERGVLYLLDGSAVPWNGLTEITDDRASEIKSYWIDGVKYLDHYVPGAYSGKISAFTYPDEFDAVLGNADFAPGVITYDQPVSLFHLSYRTLIGNDIDGAEHGYLLHVLYNLTAKQGSVTAKTIGDQIEPNVFQWDILGTPPLMSGIRPTNHISFDSRHMNPATLAEVEALLYGTDDADPAIPDLVDLLAMVEV